MKDWVSLLVTTFNMEDYVDRAMETALTQTYLKLQIIVVDDCSTDTTWKKLQKFKNKVKLVRHIKNKRVSASLNTALRLANGEHIARLDGDDQLYPTLIEKEIEFLRQHPDIDFVYCDYDEVNETGKITRRIRLPRYSKKLIHLVDYIAMGNLIPKYCYDEIGDYDESMKKQEHYDFSIRLDGKFKGALLPKSLFAYTRHAKQATANLDDLRFYTEMIRKKHRLTDNRVVKW